MLLLKSLGWICVTAGLSFMAYLLNIMWTGSWEIRGKDHQTLTIYRETDPTFFYTYWGILLACALFAVGLGYSLLRKPGH